jgi:hypothetical protein
MQIRNTSLRYLLLIYLIYLMELYHIEKALEMPIVASLVKPLYGISSFDAKFSF